MGSEPVEYEVPLVIMADKYHFYVGTPEGDNVKIVSKPFDTYEEAAADKVKKEKKKP